MFLLRRFRLFGVCFASAVLGCGRGPSAYEQLGIAPVTGRVTLDGRPLSDVRVVFVEPGSGFASVGTTDAEGRYVLRLNSSQAGVAPGRKTVRIKTGSSGEGDAELLRAESIPARYNKRSELEADVKPSVAQTFDFALESGGTIEQPDFEKSEG